MDVHGLSPLLNAVLDGDDVVAPELALGMLSEGTPADEIIAQVSVAAQELGRKYQNGECYLPELIGGAEAMTSVLNAILPAIDRGTLQPIGTVVIGVVEGDVHDIGKRIVAALLAGAGFRVHDLGIDVPAHLFATRAAELGADIVGASAYITTTTQRLAEVNSALVEAGLRGRVKYLIGGAGVSRGMVSWAGADAFGENAADAVQVALRLIAGRAEST